MILELDSKCPNCSQEVIVSTEVDKSIFAPTVRSKISPVGSLDIYKITSEEIKQFVLQKARMYIPDVNMEIIPVYTEKKRRSNEPRKSYASIRIAFSDKIIDKGDEYGFYEKLVHAEEHVKIVNSIFNNIVNLYKYDKNEVNAWLNNYKTLEILENKFGLTENFIKDIKNYAVPKTITGANGEKWVLFAASPDKILKDMLTDVKTNTMPGRMQIMDIVQLSKELVEFVVYMYPHAMNLTDNSVVREILTGNNK